MLVKRLVWQSRSCVVKWSQSRSRINQCFSLNTFLERGLSMFLINVWCNKRLEKPELWKPLKSLLWEFAVFRNKNDNTQHFRWKYVHFDLIYKYSSQYVTISEPFRYFHTFPLNLKIQTVTQFVWASCGLNRKVWSAKSFAWFFGGFAQTNWMCRLEVHKQTHKSEQSWTVL